MTWHLYTQIKIGPTVFSRYFSDVFYVVAAITIGSGMYVIINCLIVLNMSSGLALYGPIGSMMKASVRLIIRLIDNKIDD
jgi:hypothetical protein